MEMIQSFIGSACALEEKMSALKRKFLHLEGRKDDIKEEFKHEKSSFTKRPRQEVDIWLMNVESVKHEVRKLEEEVSDSTRFARTRLVRSVDSLASEVSELLSESRFPRGLTMEALGNECVPFLTRRLVGETFLQNKEMILEILFGGIDRIIGVYGIGGAGKTTLLMHIHDELLNRPDFEVAWVTVSQHFTVRGLQHAIAKTVHLDITEEDDQRIRAARIAMALKRRDNFVLLLDDVWERIDLDEVGIRVDPDHVNKLILTTRSLTVCRAMGCDAKVRVSPLSPQEAQTLFTETLRSDSWLISGEIRRVAESLVEECAGLPLGIIVIARSMRGVFGIDEWRSALDDIRSADLWHDDMEFFEVFRVLKYSYDKLKDPKLQGCFLYCSLFPEDAWIEKDDLIEYFIAEKLIEGRTSRKSMFHKGRAMLKKLESVCLLDGDGTRVKMHDLIRDTAIRIMSDTRSVLAKAGIGLRNIPNRDEWSEDLVRVSLMQNHISEIPANASPKCARLSTLLLRDNRYLKVIPDCFFKHMISLTMLDLSNTSIENLPVSISNLKCLTALLLGNCKRLSHIPSLAKLTAMAKLDLSNTSIKDLPEGTENLVFLRDLNLDSCSISTIPLGIVPKLSLLQNFSAATKLLRGEEMASLRILEAFRGRFRHIEELNACFESWRSRDPKNVYRIKMSRSGILDLTTRDGEESNNERSHEKSSLVFPIGIETLMLGECHSLQNQCGVSCGGARHMVCSCCRGNNAFTQGLESLKLVGSDSIKLTVREVAVLSSTNGFTSLKQVVISDCHGLKRLFMPAVSSNLKNLEQLEVRRCNQLEEIIGADEEEEERERVLESLPKLRSLRLYGLPRLKSLCGSTVRVPESLKEIAIMYCWELKRMTLLRDSADPHPSLWKVYVEAECWDLMEWKYPETKAVFQPHLDFSRPSFFYY